jgi:hypothetical protein
MTGASNWIGAIRARMIRSSQKRWRRNIRPSREYMGRSRNKLTYNVVLIRGNKKSRTSGRKLGRVRNGCIQSSVPWGK